MSTQPETNDRDRLLTRVFLAATAANCIFQIAWFWRFHADNITKDAVNDIGLARHLVDRNWIASIHGYWSLLFPWLIAAASATTANWTLLGRILTMGTFLLCVSLLYVLTFRLWRSRLAASFAVLWFSLARGLMALAVGSILADFLLTACVVGYFIVLLDCLQENRPGRWVLLGLAHALAFLAKAFAMPWLAIATALAVIVRNSPSPKKCARNLALAFLIPAIVWVGRGTRLKAKYGVFTTGYQLKQNLMIDLRRHQSHRVRGDDLAFVDTSSTYDAHMVAETSWFDLQHFKPRTSELLLVIAQNELANIPKAVKETLILLTPGGSLALLVGIFSLTRNRRQFFPEVAFGWIAVINLISLVAPYCMLVFDTRYLLPIVPVLMAVASCFLVPGDETPLSLRPAPLVQKTALTLTVVSVFFFLVYWASPFRSIDRDFEVSCYHAASALRSRQPGGRSLVTIGLGPYPDHGIGFVAGIYVAYFAGRHVVDMNAALPPSGDTDGLVNAVLAKKADAVIVWGSPRDPAYGQIPEKLRHATGDVLTDPVTDPDKGEVGMLLFLQPRAS